MREISQGLNISSTVMQVLVCSRFIKAKKKKKEGVGGLSLSLRAFVRVRMLL